VDDHTLVVAALERVLSREADFAVIGFASDGAGAIELVRSTQPDLVLLDLCLPDVDGIDLIPALRRISPGSKIVVVTGVDRASSARRALTAGASGYLTKTCPMDDLYRAIRRVCDGRTLVDVAREGVDVPDASGSPGRSLALQRLSDREREVLRLIALGHTNREVADLLAISSNSVATYRARICEKLDLNSRVDLVRFALDHGLLEPARDAALEARR